MSARARSLPLLLVWPALLLGGCFSGFNSNQLPQQTYVLRLQSPSPRAQSSAPAAAPAPAHEATLGVLRPVAAAGLGGDGIAVLRPGQRLDYYRGARWAAPAPAMLQTLAIQVLREDGRFALVEPDTGPFDTTYFLSVELSHFEADYDGSGPPTVRVAMTCTLGRRADRSELQSFSAASAVVAEADRMQAVAAAFEQATNQVLSQLGQQLSAPATVAAQP